MTREERIRLIKLTEHEHARIHANMLQIKLQPELYEIFEEVAAKFDTDIKTVEDVYLSFLNTIRVKIKYPDLEEQENLMEINTGFRIPMFGNLVVPRKYLKQSNFKEFWKNEKEERKRRNAESYAKWKAKQEQKTTKGENDV